MAFATHADAEAAITALQARANPNAYRGPTGAIAVTLDRMAAVLSGVVAPASGTYYPVLVHLLAGQVITNLNVRAGTATAWSGVTHSWLNILDVNRLVVASSADDTTATLAVGTNKAYPIVGGPYTVPTEGDYYFGFAFVASAGAIWGSTGVLSANGLAIPPTGAGSSNTGVTTPLAVGATANAITAANTVIPYIWAT